MLPMAFLLVTLSLSSPRVKKPVKPHLPPYLQTAADLLDEAHRLALECDTDDRAVVLLTLADASKTLSPPRHRQWSIDLFRFARYEMTGEVRRSMQKNAIVELSSVDPDLAAKFYAQQETPLSDRAQYEDARPYGAVPLFEALWQRHGKSALEKIRQLATWTGQTGQYPYEAVGDIIVNISKDDPEAANLLFSDAVDAYSDDDNYLTTNHFFVSFARHVHGRVRPDLERQALSLAIDRIQHSEDPRKLLIEAHTKGRTFTFNSEKIALLASLLPLTREVDPSLADGLQHSTTELASLSSITASDPFELTGVVKQTDDPSVIAAASDESKLDLAKQIMTTDGARALSIAREIGTPELRSLAIATVIPFANLSTTEEQDFSSQLEKQIETTAPSIMKVRLQIGLAQLMLAQKNADAATNQLNKAFDLAAELFAEDQLMHPAKTFEFLTGANELQQLATLLGQNAPDFRDELPAIREVSDDILRAQLLTFFAKGLMQRSVERR